LIGFFAVGEPTVGISGPKQQVNKSFSIFVEKQDLKFYINLSCVSFKAKSETLFYIIFYVHKINQPKHGNSRLPISLQNEPLFKVKIF